MLDISKITATRFAWKNDCPICLHHIEDWTTKCPNCNSYVKDIIDLWYEIDDIKEATYDMMRHMDEDENFAVHDYIARNERLSRSLERKKRKLIEERQKIYDEKIKEKSFREKLREDLWDEYNYHYSWYDEDTHESDLKATDENINIKSNNRIKLFFFDTETTWKDPLTASIIQFWGIFGMLDKNSLKFTETSRINQLVNVKEKIPEEASNVHWIKNEDLVEYWYIDDYIYEFLSLVKKADFVIWHNVEYDKTVLMSETKRLKIPFDFSKIEWIDTMKPTTDLVKIIWKNWTYKRPKLIELHKFLFWKEFDWAHDAMADITATKDCFIELVKKYGYFKNIINSDDNTETVNIESHTLDNKKYKKISDIKLKWLLKSSNEKLFLKWVESLRDDQLKYILDYRQWDMLIFDDLLVISDIQADLLSNYKCFSLSLEWLSSLTDKQAEYLSHFKWWLSLNWLEYINTTQARYLWMHNEFLSLNWLKHITDEQLEVFCNSISKITYPEIFILLDWLASLTNRQAEYIWSLRWSQIKISLSWLNNIPDNQLKLLLKMNGSLCLNWLESITDKQAEYLSIFEWHEVELFWVKNFSESQKEILAKSKRPILRVY